MKYNKDVRKNSKGGGSAIPCHIRHMDFNFYIETHIPQVVLTWLLMILQLATRTTPARTGRPFPEEESVNRMKQFRQDGDTDNYDNNPLDTHAL